MPTHRFGDFEYDARTGELWTHGQRIRLSSQLADLVVALIARPGELVTRETLRGLLWNADTYVDFEHGLNAAVSKLREALGDSAHVPRYVETIPRRGYRWIAPVETVEASATFPEAANDAHALPASPSLSPPDSAPRPAAGAPGRTVRYGARSWLLAGVAAVLAAAVLIAFDVGSSRTRVTGRMTTSVTSIAALPFENRGPAEEDAYLSDGLTDALITQLRKSTSLRVISRASSTQFSGTRRPLGEIARILGVDAVLEGTVQRAGDRVRISAQLVDGRTDAHLWAGSYERSFADSIPLVEEVSLSIAQQIHARIESPAQTRSPYRAPHPDAYEAYMRGRYHAQVRTEAESKKSLAYFHRAVELDRTFAPAYGALAVAYSDAAYYAFEAPLDMYPKAYEAARAALRLDDRGADAHAALATVKFLFEWDWQGAESSFRRALALQANHEIAMAGYGRLLMLAGRFDEAIALRKRIVELDPLSPSASLGLATTFLYARRYDEAIALIDRMLRDEPTGKSRMVLAATLGVQGACEKALVENDRALALLSADPTDQVILASIGWVYATCGRPEEARRILQDYEAIGPRRWTDPISMAAIRGALGETDLAIALIERGIKERSPVAVALEVDPMLDSVRGDERFRKLADQVTHPRAAPSRPEKVQR